MINDTFPNTSHFAQAYRRFFFLYGHVNDEFCPPSLGILTLEEMLYRHLKQLGYQRLVFYNGRQKIYFHDIHSRHLTRPIKNTAQHSDSQQRVTRICPGPLGQRRLRQIPALPTTASNAENAEPLQLGRMNDSEVVGFLNRCMREEQFKTAVIFTDGLDFITHFDTNAQRQMAAMLNQWGQLPSTNTNICLFFLTHIGSQTLRSTLERHEWHFLLSQFFTKDHLPSAQVIFITAPHQDEVTNLLHYWRLKKRFIADWQTWHQHIAQLTRRLRAQGASLKSFSYQLQQCQTLDTIFLTEFHEKPLSALERLRQLKGLEVVAEKLMLLIARHQEHHATPTATAKTLTVNRLLPTIPKVGLQLNVHLALKGNPGTGKTTVAQLIAEIYRDLGLLELGHLVKVSREDLVAEYVGQTALKTAQKVTDAMGGVLFVDEAYRLSEGDTADFGREAIETIMEAMSNRAGEFAVIIAGYPQRIETFLDSNPGLRRRFGESNILTIPDYEPAVLHHIFLQQVKREQRQLAPDLQARLADFFYNWHFTRHSETFGNAGEVLNLYQAMDERRAVRVQSSPVETDRFILTSVDVPDSLQVHLQPRQTDDPEVVLNDLNRLVGLQRVKQTVRSLVNTLKIQKLRGETAHLSPGHYLFMGNPGTGKTTVARFMGQIFRALGLLHKGHLVEVGRADMVAGYMGQSALKTREVLTKSLNGVLFIDEAYQLIQGERDEFGKEAVETLLGFMENHRENLCIIAAGYPQQMKQFLNSNPGLPSRFTTELIFDDYTATEMLAIFQQMVAEKHLTMGPELEPALLQIFQHWEHTATFGNARTLRKLLDTLCLRQNDRLIASQTTETTLNINSQQLYELRLEDIPELT